MRTPLSGAIAGGRGSDALVVEQLSRSFGSHEVVRSFDLMLAPGERVALRGPNGSGKTTILRCIAGTLTPSGGRATIQGHAVGSVNARRLIGVSLSQERSFYLRLTGRQNLTFVAQLRGYRQRSAERLVDALGEELQLGAILAERADRCSTGMIQQLALARALLGDPPLVLLDEPTRSLDTRAVERLWGAVDRRRETAFLITTHLQDDIDRCDRSIELPS